MRRMIVAMVTILVVAAGAWLLLRPNDESIIKELLSDAALQASFDVNEHPIARLGAAKELSELCVEGTRITLATEVDERQFVFSISDIRDKIVALRTSLAQLAVSFQNVQVQVTGGSARVTAVGIAMGRDHGRDDYFMERHPLEIRLERTEEGWKIFSARNLDTIVVE